MSKRRRVSKAGLVAPSAVCKIEGCQNEVDRLGMCCSHYTRNYRHGDPLGGGTSQGDLARFVDLAIAHNSDECLLWPYGTNGIGYGQIRVNRKATLVHRLVCEAVHGPSPSEKMDFALHSCGNGHMGCVTPRHLRWGSRLDNADDAILHGATPKGTRNWNAKLTEIEVLAIRNLSPISSRRELSEKFGVVPSAISNIIARRRWGWLE